MLSDPVAEAFGLIHRHPSGENLWYGRGGCIRDSLSWLYSLLEMFKYLFQNIVFLSFLAQF